jgi:ArsR family transcriptional regulator, virulence genes transcriptional regulator
MKEATAISPSKMGASAGKAAALMKMLSNEHRLLILCHLIAEEEISVSDLTSRIGLSQSALSQHLAKLRDQHLVVFRREAQTLFYRIGDERAAQVLLLLHEMFCSDDGTEASWKSPKSSERPGRQKGLVGTKA